MDVNIACWHCWDQKRQGRLEREEKTVRDFGLSFGAFSKNIECRDLRIRMDEGQKGVREHFAPWAKVQNASKLFPRVFRKPSNGRDGKK